ncbi:MAG: preprotein translocase subunit SecA [Clostridiales bacterium]|nr:preprotein translocase subunit SecA [Candidatus Apopatousia equi]
MGLISYIFASDNSRNVKKLSSQAKKVMALEEKYQKMTDEELANMTKVFKGQLENGKTLNDIMYDAYAVVREASFRVLKQKHYFVQVIGGIALHQGRIAEMRTGEGKTLTETLPAYLNALSGKGVHIVTVNEYLAKRDSEWMGKIFEFLGLKVGITLSGMNDAQKREAYLCDITYGTNSEFGFDYLRDNMCVKLEQKVQRGHNFAIVDEVDSVLIDEARTPLIISGGKGFRSNEDYVRAQSFVYTLKKDEDVEIDEEKKQIRLTESGISKAERFYRVENLSDIENMEMNHYINNALRANFMMFRDSNYIVDEKGEVLIVDEFTGRVMPGRRFSDGLHQAIEAKEGVKVNDENITVATITYQNYFRLYKKLSGMTGTAKTEEVEFNKIYKLDVVTIPTNKPIQRYDAVDVVYSTKNGKLKAIVREIVERHKTGQPILVGTVTVEKSEEISDALKKENVKHVVLNAKNHEKESEIIAQAGKVGAVTIATNMAGRGTDILLGGNPEFLAKQQMKQEAFEEQYIAGATSFAPTTDEKQIEAKKRYDELYESFKKETDKEKEEVLKLGGLFILGTERHESRRIDNQLRGRSGRQGDPGESMFFISLEDDIARIFGGEKLKRIASLFKMDEDEALFQMKFISKQIENAQKRVEGSNFGVRRTLLQFDDVLNEQRNVIYGERDKILEGDDFHEEILSMVYELVSQTVYDNISDEKAYYEWDLDTLNKRLEEFVLPKETNLLNKKNVEEKEVNDIVEMVYAEVVKNLDKKAEEVNEMLPPDGFKKLERWVLLGRVDNAWVEHIDSMTIMKHEILTRTDPINAYKQEGFDMFENMISSIRENTAKMILNAKIEKVVQKPMEQQKKNIVANATPVDKQSKTVKNTKREVGRNDPCPCGSGKKYKNCCMNKQ